MSNSTSPLQISKMTWATRLKTNSHTGLETWCFQVQGQDMVTPIKSENIKHVNPAGQWVICDMIEKSDYLEMMKISTLPNSYVAEHNEKIKFHLQCAHQDQHYQVFRLWSFYHQITEANLKDFFYEILSNKIFIVWLYSFQDKNNNRQLTHSINIADNAKKIATQINVSKNVTDLSFIAGLLYNIKEFNVKYLSDNVYSQQSEERFVQNLVIREQLIKLKEKREQPYHILLRCLQINNKISNNPYLVELITHMALKISK